MKECFCPLIKDKCRVDCISRFEEVCTVFGFFYEQLIATQFMNTMAKDAQKNISQIFRMFGNLPDEAKSEMPPELRDQINEVLKNIDKE